MRLVAIAFVGLSLLIVAIILAAMAYNPSRHDPFFVAQVVLVFGGLSIWSTVAAWQMWTRERTWIGCALIGFLSVMVAIGIAKFGSLEVKEKIHPALHTLRLMTGLYLVFLWILLGFVALRSKARSE